MRHVHPHDYITFLTFKLHIIEDSLIIISLLSQTTFLWFCCKSIVFPQLKRMDSLGKPHCPDSRCTQIVLLLHSSLHRMLKVAEKKKKTQICVYPQILHIDWMECKIQKGNIEQALKIQQGGRNWAPSACWKVLTMKENLNPNMLYIVDLGQQMHYYMAYIANLQMRVQGVIMRRYRNKKSPR